MGIKPCRKCGSTEKLKDGRCAPCKRASKVRWRTKNREKERTYSVEYRAKNKEKIKAGLASWYADNPGKKKEYSAKYYSKNPEKVKAFVARWQSKNPEKVRVIKARRRALKAQAIPLDAKNCPRVAAVYFIASWLREQGDDVHVDHIQPLAKGGLHVYENLRILPAKENISKMDRLPTPEERKIQKVLKASATFLC